MVDVMAQDRIAELEAALDLFVSFGCPVCHGDCASANPPVAMCPMIEARCAKAIASPVSDRDAEQKEAKAEDWERLARQNYSLKRLIEMIVPDLRDYREHLDEPGEVDRLKSYLDKAIESLSSLVKSSPSAGEREERAAAIAPAQDVRLKPGWLARDIALAAEKEAVVTTPLASKAPFKELELNELFCKARARFDRLSSEERTELRYEQKRSFIKGMCADDQDYDEWCKYVDKMMPPATPPASEAVERAMPSDEDLAKRVNLSLLMCRGISEVNAGFDQVVSVNDDGLRAITKIFRDFREALTLAPTPAVDVVERARKIIEQEHALSERDDKNDIQLYALRLARVHTAQQILGERPLADALSSASSSVPTPAPVSVSDPRTIIAGIRQFGLAADGSDLRDLEAALSPAPASGDLEEKIAREIHQGFLRSKEPIEIARAIIPLLPAAAVPEGWQLVPKEPTKEMLDVYQYHFVGADRFDPIIVWKGMLSAAPSLDADKEK